MDRSTKPRSPVHFPRSEVFRQAVAVQWLRHISSFKHPSSALAPQRLAALDQGHSSASETQKIAQLPLLLLSQSFNQGAAPSVTAKGTLRHAATPWSRRGTPGSHKMPGTIPHCNETQFSKIGNLYFQKFDCLHRGHHGP